MTSSTVSPATGVLPALRRAAEQATLAPSVHNTQPWRFILEPARLTLLADRTRRLSVLDPTGRQLTVSCGAALLNARVSLAVDGLGPDLVEFPEGARADSLGVLDLRAPLPADPALAALAPFIARRQTNRRRFDDIAVPAALMADLQAAAAAEHATLYEIDRQEHRDAVARLAQRADAQQNADPAYRAEIRAWTTEDRSRPDGVPALAVPHVDGTAEDDIPIRDFDTRGSGFLPPKTRSSRTQCLFLLCSDSDEPRGWLRAGQALERVLLEVTRHGYSASLFTQVIEVPAVRSALRSELGLREHPIVLLRVGRAAPTPGTLRRPPKDVLIDRTISSGR